MSPHDRNMGAEEWRKAALGDEPDPDERATVIKAIAETQEKERETGTPIDKIEIAEELPILPLQDIVIYPHIVAPLLVTEDSLIKLIDDSLTGDRIIGIVAAQEGVEEETPPPEKLYDVG